ELVWMDLVTMWRYLHSHRSAGSCTFDNVQEPAHGCCHPRVGRVSRETDAWNDAWSKKEAAASLQIVGILRLPAVREGGVEPPRPCGHTDLNRARLPIPPLARCWR